MTINSIKIKFIIAGVYYLVGSGLAKIHDPAPETNRLISCEEDNRVDDTNYLDGSPPEAETPGGNRGILIVIGAVIACLAFVGFTWIETGRARRGLKYWSKKEKFR